MKSEPEHIKTEEEIKQELEIELQVIKHILMNAQESFKIVRIFQVKADDADLSYIKRTNTFCAFTAAMLWRAIVMELTKLLLTGIDHQYNIFALINRFRTDFAPLKVDTSKIDKWRAVLKAEQKTIDNLQLQRNKLYAHTAREHDEIVPTVTMAKTEELIIAIQQLIRTIYSDVFETALQIENPINGPADGLNKILELAVYGKKAKLELLRPLAEKYGLEGELGDKIEP